MAGRTLVALLILLVGSAAACPATAQEPSESETPWLQPGDMLRVQVWREEDLSGEFVVDEDGHVTLPMLGRRRAVGIPIDQLRTQLIAEFTRQLNNPSIQITPLRRIFVLGEVARPGSYALDPTLSLAGAVALAGGATPNGDLNRIQVVRNGAVFRSRVAPFASLQTVDIRSGDQIFIGERGWFSRNSTFLVSAMLSMAGIIVSVLATR
jgi:polysaccharide biosynthesis/export protein